MMQNQYSEPQLVQEKPTKNFSVTDFKRTKFRDSINRNGYEVIRPLGYGAFGHVTLCKGTTEEAQGYYAIKTQRLKGSELTPDQAAKEKNQQKRESVKRAKTSYEIAGVYYLDINKVKSKSRAILNLKKDGEKIEGNDEGFLKELI